MSSKKILMPNGEIRTYYCSDDQSWQEIIEEKILPYWLKYCDNNWISPNHEAVYAPEKRVKWFLDRLGWLLIEGAGGIESEYKNMSHTVREIPVTECPADVSDFMYSDRHVPQKEYNEDGHFDYVLDQLNAMDKRKTPKSKKERVKTRFERMADIDKSFPGSTKTWCVVDNENCFSYGGKVYSVPNEMRGYIDDAQMDRILVVESARALRFYDQNVENMFIVA